MSPSRCALLLLAVLFAFMRPADAQEVVGQAGPFAMPISSRSVERLAATLKLDADQKALARALYAGYRSSFRQAAQAGDDETKVLNDKAREDPANAEQNYRQLAKDRIRIMRTFVSKAESLERSFLDDLKAILTPDQAALFERAERTRRREVGLKFSFVSGEAVDIFQILNDLKIDRDGSPALAEELDPYESELDRAIIAKQKMLRGVYDQMEKFEGPEGDMELIKKTLTDFLETGLKLRDTHRALTRRLTPKLPPEKQDAFDRAVKKASFPRVYKESDADKALAAARGLSDLSADQKAELASIADTYRRDADAANARWSTAIEDKQAKFVDNIMAMMGGMGPEPDDDPLKVAREARKALDERTVARITQLLTPEQRERMPAAAEEADWSGNEHMPDFDEHDNWEQWKNEDGPEAQQPRGDK